MKPLLHKLASDNPNAASAISTVQALRRLWPTWGHKMDELEAKLKANKGAGGRGCDWEASEEGDSQKMQRVHSAQVYAHTLKSFHNAISVPESVDVSLGSGPEPSAYLVAEEGTPGMNDRDLRTTLRRKLRVDVIEGSNGVCQHARTNLSRSETLRTDG